MTSDLDALREKFPHLGFAVYAYEPDKDVVLEILVPGGRRVEVKRPTLAACIAEAFPEPQTPEPETNEPDAFG